MREIVESSERNASVGRFTQAGLVAVVILGAAVRLLVREGVAFSPADEARYLAMARSIVEGGLGAYPALVAEHLQKTWLHEYPSPLRYAHVILAALACKLHGSVSFAALAGLSTAAGVVTVGATAALGARMASVRHGVVAALFIAVSPLQLALGRRALQDEVVVASCALTLLAFTYVERDLRFVAGKTLASAGLFVASASVFLALKETSALLYISFIALVVVDACRRRGSWAPRVFLVLVPPAVAVLGFLLLGGSLEQGLDLMRLSAASAETPYARAYMAGPPHRVVVDLFLLVPCTVALAAAGLGESSRLRTSAGWRVAATFATFATVALVVAAGLPKNVRFTAVVEPLLAIYAADTLLAWSDRTTRAATRLVVMGAGCMLPVLASWAIFTRVFLERGVYDPTTVDLLAALDAVPHRGPMGAGTLAAPWLVLLACATAFTVAWTVAVHDEA